MMIIISIALMYLSLINIYFCVKEKKKSLGFRKWSQYFFSLFILLSFFREMKVLDLKYFFFNFFIHYEIYYNFCVKYYKYFFWLNRLMFMFLIFFFVRDCISYDFVLNDCLYFMKFYSLFKVFYIMLNFIALKQELMLDYYLFNLYYKEGVSLDEGFFAETLPQRYNEVDDYENDVIKS